MKENNEQRSFNILGKPFQIPIKNLIRYPNTLLADTNRLQLYWRPSLNAYFLSRNVQIFEHVILPFYNSSDLTNKIYRSAMISLPEKFFREELMFYNLLDYYQTDDISNLLFEYHSRSSTIISLLSRLLIQKSICHCIFDSASCISCGIGIYEMVRWQCQYRLKSLLIGDIILSLILLWILFYEQYIDKIQIKIQAYLYNTIKNRKIHAKMSKQSILIASFQSFTFRIQMIFASFSFILTLLSYKQKGTWYFALGIAFRHLLLLRLCSKDLCHLIDVLYYSGRLSLRVYSNFILFLTTIIFICVWTGVTIYITDSQSTILDSTNRSIILAPSRYFYFIYHVLLNVGYGDTSEQSFLSSVFILIMTLIVYPLLTIIYQKFIYELNVIMRKMIHIKTWHQTSFINHLITQTNKYYQLKPK